MSFYYFGGEVSVKVSLMSQGWCGPGWALPASSTILSMHSIIELCLLPWRVQGE